MIVLKANVSLAMAMPDVSVAVVVFLPPKVPSRWLTCSVARSSIPLQDRRTGASRGCVNRLFPIGGVGERVGGSLTG